MVEMSLVRTNDMVNGTSMVVNIALNDSTENTYCVRRGGLCGTQCNNQTEMVRGEWGGTKVSNSNNLSILFARFPVLMLYFVRLILLPDRGSRPRADSVGETKRR